MSAAHTTVVRPADPTLQPALRLALFFAAIKLLLHIATNLWEAHIGYGYFRDELYYLICSRHLAWGYVDQGPIVALQAKFALLFGKSLAGIRMLSALSGAGRVFLTGILAWSLGGRRPAQALAMIGVLKPPQYLGLDSSSFDELHRIHLLDDLSARPDPDPSRRQQQAVAPLPASPQASACSTSHR